MRPRAKTPPPLTLVQLLAKAGAIEVSVLETETVEWVDHVRVTGAALLFGLPPGIAIAAGVYLADGPEWAGLAGAVVFTILLSARMLVIEINRRVPVYIAGNEKPIAKPESMLQPSSGQAIYALYTDLAKAFLRYMCKEPGKPLIVRNWKPAGRHGFTQETFKAVLSFLDNHAMLSNGALTVAAKRDMGKWAADVSDDAPDGKLPDSLVEDFRKLESSRPSP